MLESAHRDSVPEHSLQLPPMHTGELPLHALPAIHEPPTQNSGVMPFLQRFSPFVHPQVPFVQTGVSPVQAGASSQAFCELQICGVEPLAQRLVPGVQATH
jgi:hypothetical protein